MGPQAEITGVSGSPRYAPAAPGSSKSPARVGSFHLPFEHGAWWTFHTCLAAGLIQALAHQAPLLAVLGLAFSLEALFLMSDWLTGLAGLALQGRKRRRSDFYSAPGLALAAVAALGLWLSLGRVLPSQRIPLAASFGAASLLALAILALRLNIQPRSLRLLMPSALLLTAPVFLLAGLGMGFGMHAAAYWGLFAWFFTAEVLYVSTWMRGTSLPRSRMVLASLPFLIQAGYLASLSRWQGTLVLIAMTARVFWRIKERMDERPSREGYPFLPTDPKAIRRMGYEQVAWSGALAAIWIWRYWPGVES